MTPDDVAALRTNIVADGCWHDEEFLALCDALEAAWAERDEAKTCEDIWAERYDEQRERAERAEADLAEHIEAGSQAFDMERRRAERAEEQLTRVAHDLMTKDRATLARVRALCDPSDAHWPQWVSTDDIRAALDGDTNVCS